LRPQHNPLPGYGGVLSPLEKGTCFCRPQPCPDRMGAAGRANHGDRNGVAACKRHIAGVTDGPREAKANRKGEGRLENPPGSFNH
jgi:hypothetical protein